MSGPGTPWVLKAGGRELREGPTLTRLAGVVGRAVRAGRPTVLVHGGGEEVSERAEALGLPTARVAGQRVTDAATLEVVVEVLAGRINLRLVRALEREGVRAVGLTGADGGLLKVRPAGDPPGALGLVGTPTAADAPLLERLWANGLTPVVAPLGLDVEGRLYNVNADLAASALAAALTAELAILTDVPGVLDARGELLPSLARDELDRLRASGAVTGGMIPKLEAVDAALGAGVRTVWIGNLEGLELPDGPGRGTRVAADRSGPPARLPLRQIGGVPT